MKEHRSGSKKKSRQDPPAASSQASTPKWRLVFGQPLPPGFTPPPPATNQAPAAKAGTKKTPNWLPAYGQAPAPAGQPTPRYEAAKNQGKGAHGERTSPKNASKSAKPKSPVDYFAKMDATERILFAYIAFRQPQDWSRANLVGRGIDSLHFLDRNLAGPGYPEIDKMIMSWTESGLLDFRLVKNKEAYSLAEGVAGLFWQWLEKKRPVEAEKVEPEQQYPADLPGTLDNVLNFLLLVERGEVLVTRNREINKFSLKRILATIKEPAWPPQVNTPENYFFWLLSVVQILRWVGIGTEGLQLTEEGRALSQNFDAGSFLTFVCADYGRSITLKGFYLVFPLLAGCTKWTSWAQLVEGLLAPAENAGNLLQRDCVIAALDPWRFWGLLDWGVLQQDILIKVTPLGQFLFPKLLAGQDLGRYAAEIQALTADICPTSEPDQVIVQPNFEILVPRSATWATRWQLSQFAVLDQQDQMLKYHLDKHSVLDGLKRGYPSDGILSLLAGLCPYPLPENVVLSIREWIGSFAQVTFMHFTLLECTTPEQAASIASARRYKDYVIGLYSPTAVIVREPEKLRKLLEKQGIYPLPGVLTGEETAGRKGLTYPSGGSGT